MTKPWTRWRVLKLRVGFWLIGGDAMGLWSVLWLIRERAMRAVTRDGGVILAECQSLADALYEQTPGRWRLTLTEMEPSSPQCGGTE